MGLTNTNVNIVNVIYTSTPLNTPTFLAFMREW